MPGDPSRPGEIESRILQLLNAFLTVQALHVAAALGIPDLLADGPATADRLAMLLAHKGGRIRTEGEFRDLFKAAGLRLTRMVPTASPNSILKGVLA